MRKPPFSSFFVIVLALFAGTPSIRAAVGPDETFAAANRDFEAGKFVEASAAYLELAQGGHISSDLYFNLGAAAYRLGKTGEAVLWMRRALVVEPGMPEVRQSLEFLSERIGYLEFTVDPVARFIRAVSAAFFKWAVTLALWTTLISLLLAFTVERLRPNRPALITVATLSGAVAFAAFSIGHYRASQLAVENFATITAENADALTAPVPEARSVIKLPPGSEVRLLRQSGQWHYAEIPGDLRGWLRTETLAPVWPLSLSTTSP
jgi:hypothetical protein